MVRLIGKRLNRILVSSVPRFNILFLICTALPKRFFEQRYLLVRTSSGQKMPGKTRGKRKISTQLCTNCVQLCNIFRYINKICIHKEMS